MNLPYAVLDYSLANAEGAPRNRALMLGLMGGMLKSPALGLLFAAVLGRRRPLKQPAGMAIGPPVTTTQTAVSAGNAPSAAPPALTFTPSFHGHSRTDAETIARLLELTLLNKNMHHPGEVLKIQTPQAGDLLPADRTITLTWETR